jgi:hypothetical protein
VFAGVSPLHPTRTLFAKRVPDSQKPLKTYISQYFFKVLEVPRNFFQEVSWWGAGATPLHAASLKTPI